MKDRKLNKNYENNRESIREKCFSKAQIVLLSFNLLFAVANIVVLCILFPSSQDLCVDYMGIIVGILAILVTVLVGWQIFNNIDFKDKIEKKIENQYYELKNELDSKSKELIKDINEKSERSAKNSLFVSLCQLGNSLNHCKNAFTIIDGSENQKHNYNEIDATSIQVLFNALSIYNDSMDDGLSKEAYSVCLLILKEYAKNKDAILTVSSKDEYDFFTQTAIDTKDIEIIKFAENFKIQA